VQFYRYTDDFEAILIDRTGIIQPAPGQQCKWYTPNRYDTGDEAQRYLALTYKPTYRIGPISDADLPPFDYASLKVVDIAFGQPGGGLEAATTQPAFLFKIARLP
jgi:hypothetical protein